MTYANCTQAYAAGRSNIPASDPAYSRKLDRDGDGVACDNPPAGFVPKPVATSTKPSAHTSVKPSPSTTTSTTAPAPALPTTGPGEAFAIGSGVLLAGALAVAVVKRRRTRFVA